MTDLNVLPNTSQVMTEARLLAPNGQNEWRRMLFTSNRYDNCPNVHYKRVLFRSQSSSCWIIASLSCLFVSQSLCPDLLESSCCFFRCIAPFFFSDTLPGSETAPVSLQNSATLITLESLSVQIFAGLLKPAYNSLQIFFRVHVDITGFFSYCYSKRDIFKLYQCVYICTYTYMNKKKIQGNNCVDTTVCFLQATMVSFPPTGELRLMAVCLPEDSGVVFFSGLGPRGKMGRPSISLSSYQRARANQAVFVPLHVGLRRCNRCSFFSGCGLCVSSVL